MFIIPTLNRPAQCAAMVKQALLMDASAQLCVFVNGKGHADEYRTALEPYIKDIDIIYNNKNLGALGALDYAYQHFRLSSYFGFIGDDEWIETKGWSKKLIEQAGNWNISHANDGWQSGGRIHSHVCVGGALARTVGYLTIPGCWHWYGFDTLWEVIGKTLGLQRFLYDIKADHRNYMRDEKLTDECYMLGESKKDQDYERIKKWEAEEKHAVLDRIVKRLNQLREEKNAIRVA